MKLDRSAGVRFRTLCGVGLAILLSFAQSAHAQLSPPSQAVPQGSPIPRILPPTPPSVQPGGITPPPAPSGAVPATPVAVRRVSVEGVTVYPEGEISAMAAGLVGPAVPLTQIDAVRQQILRRYRDDGYVLTAVTATVDPDGSLHFRITEGHIADVKLDGDIGPAGVQVLRFLNHLTEPTAIDARTLERWLLLAQDVPGVTVHAVLRPSTDQPGALTLVAQVSRRPVTGLITADNRAFRQTGPEEALAVADFNSFTSYGERTEVSLYRTFNATQIFGQASSEMFLGGSGLKLRIYAGAGNSTPSGVLRAIGYDGFTTVFGGALSYPVIRARQQTLNVSGIFDAIESNIDENTGPDGASTRASYDSLRVLRWAGDYALSDELLGSARPAINGISLRLSKGLSGLGATPFGYQFAARQNEQPAFFKANADLTRTQTLFTPWPDASVALMGLLSGQITPDILPPVEEFYLGGARITRGFYSGEVTGDNALAATVELQLNTVVNLSALGYAVGLATQYYTFYDWGETWQNQKTDPNHRLQSFGIGARVTVNSNTEVDIEGVRRLTRFPTGNNPGVSELPATAFYWRLLARF